MRTGLDDMSRDDNELGVFSHTVQEMARKINSGSWRMFVLTEQWNEVMLNKKGSDRPTDRLWTPPPRKS